jgi:hypothetical protein
MSFPGDPLPARRAIVKAPAAPPAPAKIVQDYLALEKLVNDTLEKLAVAMEADRELTLAQFDPSTVSHGGIRAGFNRAIEMVRAAKKP